MTDSDRQETLNNYRLDLLSGRTLLLHEQSHHGRRSTSGYMPPIDRRKYSHLMGTIADMASKDDRLARVAAGIFGRVNLYGTDAQACAAVYGAAYQVMNKPYEDVIRRAGPEPGRYSDHQHEWTLYDRVAVHYWLELATRGMRSDVAGVGWALAEIAEEVHFIPTPKMAT